MIMAKTKTAAKATKAKNATETQLPVGYKPIRGFAERWDYDAQPAVEGEWGEVRTVEIKRGRKVEEGRVCDLVQDDGVSLAIWESAGLRGLFEQAEPGQRVYIRYDGLGTIRKAGQNPPKRFTVGIAD
jgi:hypothetical protein